MGFRVWGKKIIMGLFPPGLNKSLGTLIQGETPRMGFKHGGSSANMLKSPEVCVEGAMCSMAYV